MSNMSYCRFENTAKDLLDCLIAIENNEINDLSSIYEVRGLSKILEYSGEILGYKSEIEEAVNQGEKEH
jgi:hypothetical protein